MSSCATSWRAHVRAIRLGLVAVFAAVAMLVSGLPAASAAQTAVPAATGWGSDDDFVPANTRAPYITGTKAVGQTVRLNAGKWDNTDEIDTAWVAWTVGGKQIRKTEVDWPWNGSVYADKLVVPGSAAKRTLKAELIVDSWDLNRKLRVKSGGISVAYGKFAKTTKPTITGTKRVGSTLKAKSGAWSPKASFKYQWLRNGKAIKGATRSSYKVTATDRKKKISVRAKTTNVGYAQQTKISGAVRIGAGVFVKSAAPKVTGSAVAGNRLAVRVSGWSPKASFKYQWLRNGKAIKGAKKSSYKLKAADIGKRVSVRVAGKKKGYTTKTRTSASKKVGAYRFVLKKRPTISGSRKAGATLTAKKLVVSPKASKYSYRWLRNGKAISGATKSKFKVRSRDKGAKISVKVTASKKHYKSVSSTSKAVKIYKPAKKRSWAYPSSRKNCPASHPVKGNQSGIYHVPGGRWYAVTNPEECFASAGAAQRAGYRASRNG